jgi:hypothetical protein
VKSDALKTDMKEALEIRKHVYTDVKLEIQYWSCNITRMKDSMYSKIV